MTPVLQQSIVDRYRQLALIGRCDAEIARTVGCSEFELQRAILLEALRVMQADWVMAAFMLLIHERGSGGPVEMDDDELHSCLNDPAWIHYVFAECPWLQPDKPEGWELFPYHARENFGSSD